MFRDIWFVISEFIIKNNWKSFIFTCKMFYGFHNQDKLYKYCNPLLTLYIF